MRLQIVTSGWELYAGVKTYLPLLFMAGTSSASVGIRGSTNLISSFSRRQCHAGKAKL